MQHIKQIKSHMLEERKTESVTKITFATGAISAAMWTMCKPELHSIIKYLIIPNIQINIF